MGLRGAVVPAAAPTTERLLEIDQATIGLSKFLPLPAAPPSSGFSSCQQRLGPHRCMGLGTVSCRWLMLTAGAADSGLLHPHRVTLGFSVLLRTIKG